MLGIVRRVVIFAAVDGLILQAHGPIDHHKLLRIDYRSNKVVSCPPSSLPPDHEFVSLESHGIIGEHGLASVRELRLTIFSKVYSPSSRLHI